MIGDAVSLNRASRDDGRDITTREAGADGKGKKHFIFPDDLYYRCGAAVARLPLKVILIFLARTALSPWSRARWGAWVGSLSEHQPEYAHRKE